MSQDDLFGSHHGVELFFLESSFPSEEQESRAVTKKRRSTALWNSLRDFEYSVTRCHMHGIPNESP